MEHFRGGLPTVEEGDEGSLEFQLLASYCRPRYFLHEGRMVRYLFGGGATDQQLVVVKVAAKLESIVHSVPFPQEEDVKKGALENQDELALKLVELLKRSGDKLNDEIKQDQVLQQQLRRAFDYTLFERVTSALQSLVVAPGPGACAARGQEGRMRWAQIAWAFEATRRLSAMDVIVKRRVLGFGERYLLQHHSAWVQQQGGWEKAFDTEEID